MRSAYQLVCGHHAAAACGELAAMMAEVAPDVQWTEMAGFPCAGIHLGPAQVIEIKIVARRATSECTSHP